MNGETGGKAGHPTRRECAWESRGGRGPAMMGTQFGTKLAYAALGLCCRGLVLAGAGGNGIARGEGPGSCSGCAGRRGSRG